MADSNAAPQKVICDFARLNYAASLACEVVGPATRAAVARFVQEAIEGPYVAPEKSPADGESGTASKTDAP